MQSAGISANKIYLKTVAVRSAIPSAGKTIADIRVSGKVVDEKGEPLIGVSVKVDGAASGVSTDVNGMFSIDVAENGVLVFSYVGYEAKQVPVAGKTTLNVTLSPSTNNLREVVVTALGIRKDERNLGYSVSTVNGENFK